MDKQSLREKYMGCLAALNTEKCINKQESLLRELFTFLEGSPTDLLFSDLTQDGVQAYQHLVSKLTDCVALTTGNINEDDAYNEDFTGTIRKASIVFEILTSLLAKLDEFSQRGKDEASFRTAVLKATLADYIILTATHAEQHVWSSESTNKNASDLQDKICQVCQCPSIRDLLCGSKVTTEEKPGMVIRKGIFGKVLMKLRPSLTRDTWKREPASRHVYKWCLFRVKHPYLGDFLDDVLPPALLLVDDYQLQNKILGIQCLHHIISNVDPTELKWFDRAMVVYEALHKQIYSQEPALLDALFPCLVELLGVIERSPRKSDHPRKTNRYDGVLQVVLTNMEMEQKIILRRIYSEHLHLFVEKMGITVVRHFKRLLRVIVGYLEVFDGPEETARLNMLKLLNLVVVETWPRIPDHVDTLLKSLLRLTLDIATDESTTPPQVKQNLLDWAVKCLVILRKCCHPHVEKSLQEVLTIADNEVVQKCIKQVVS